jgi:hypothetical protein
MNPYDYAKLLLESSFKESQNFWIRNSGFIVFHSALVVFVLDYLNNSPQNNSLQDVPLVIPIVGLLVALVHLQMIRVSAYYNHAWFDTLKDWVNKQKSISNSKDTGVWSHFEQHLRDYDNKLPCPRLHCSKLAIIPIILLIIFWCSIFYTIYFK